MKTITNYREFSDNNSDDSMLEYIGNVIRLSDKEKILEHFKKYSSESAVLSQSACDYVTGKNLPNSILCYTDGIYVWTNEEVYHFNKYNLKLNDDFLNYVLNT